jgi:hypothetical protein
MLTRAPPELGIGRVNWRIWASGRANYTGSISGSTDLTAEQSSRLMTRSMPTRWPRSRPLWMGSTGAAEQAHGPATPWN